MHRLRLILSQLSGIEIGSTLALAMLLLYFIVPSTVITDPRARAAVTNLTGVFPNSDWALLTGVLLVAKLSALASGNSTFRFGIHFALIGFWTFLVSVYVTRTGYSLAVAYLCGMILAQMVDVARDGAVGALALGTELTLIQGGANGNVTGSQKMRALEVESGVRLSPVREFCSYLGSLFACLAVIIIPVLLSGVTQHLMLKQIIVTAGTPTLTYIFYYAVAYLNTGEGRPPNPLPPLPKRRRQTP